jgi:hypothetical protein
MPDRIVPIPCHVNVPDVNKLKPQTRQALAALATMIQQDLGYNMGHGVTVACTALLTYSVHDLLHPCLGRIFPLPNE